MGQDHQLAGQNGQLAPGRVPVGNRPGEGKGLTNIVGGRGPAGGHSRSPLPVRLGSLELPRHEAWQVERNVSRPGDAPSWTELQLVLLFVARDRLFTDDAGGANPGSAPRPIRVPLGQLATPKAAARLRPAEGRPAIVTGCAGVSCPVTLVGWRVGLGPRDRAPPPRRRDRYSTSTVTQLGACVKCRVSARLVASKREPQIGGNGCQSSVTRLRSSGSSMVAGLLDGRGLLDAPHSTARSRAHAEAPTVRSRLT
jgi:hypothetical protein